jgi:hypothetical protein
MRDFKFFKDNDTQLLRVNNLLTIQPQIRYDNVEFCFQFDDDEPTVFANGTEEISIRIEPTNGGNITFTTNDKQFTIFARERQ